MERIIQLQLLNYLKANNILVPFQSGFRASHSTVTALIKGEVTVVGERAL